MDGQDAHPTRNSLFVEQASCLLLTLVQDLSLMGLVPIAQKNQLSRFNRGLLRENQIVKLDQN